MAYLLMNILLTFQNFWLICVRANELTWRPVTLTGRSIQANEIYDKHCSQIKLIYFTLDFEFQPLFSDATAATGFLPVFISVQ